MSASNRSTPAKGDEPAVDGEPVRLRVRYESAASAIEEYARSIARGGVVLSTRRPVPFGSRFVFEVSSPDQTQPLEIAGLVDHVQPTSSGFEVAIAYQPTEQRKVLDKLLARLQPARGFVLERRHPRIPVNLIAFIPGGCRVNVADLSWGGMRLTGRLASSLVPGSRVGMRIEMPDGVSELLGRVAWRRNGDDDQIGVMFDPLEADAEDSVDALLRLERPLRVTIEPRVGVLPSKRHDAASVPDLICNAFEEAANDRFELLGDFALAPAASTTGATFCVQVPIGGDIVGRLMLEAEAGASSRLATRLTGESVSQDDHELMLDVIGETLTRIASTACDRLERSGFSLDLRPPIVARLPPRPDRAVRIAGFRGVHGRVQLTIVLDYIAAAHLGRPR